LRFWRNIWFLLNLIHFLLLSKMLHFFQSHLLVFMFLIQPFIQFFLWSCQTFKIWLLLRTTLYPLTTFKRFRRIEEIRFWHLWLGRHLLTINLLWNLIWLVLLMIYIYLELFLFCLSILFLAFFINVILNCLQHFKLLLIDWFISIALIIPSWFWNTADIIHRDSYTILLNLI
jgi:hypothetical protein